MENQAVKMSEEPRVKNSRIKSLKVHDRRKQPLKKKITPKGY